MVYGLASLCKLHFASGSGGTVLIDLGGFDRHHWLVAADVLRSFYRVRLGRKVALRFHINRLSQRLVCQGPRRAALSDFFRFIAPFQTILQFVVICLECRLIPLRQQQTILEWLRSHVRLPLPLCLYTGLPLVDCRQSIVDLLGKRLATTG